VTDPIYTRNLHCCLHHAGEVHGMELQSVALAQGLPDSTGAIRNGAKRVGRPSELAITQLSICAM
jgi:hypothetical protein